MIDWNAFPRHDDNTVRELLAAHAEAFDRPDPLFGAIVDVDVFADGGAVELPPGRYNDLTIPAIAGSIIVRGDLTVDGVMWQTFNTAPLLVDGDFIAAHVITSSELVVMGSVRTGVFYGNSTNYDTVIYGDVTAESIVLERNHHFAVHGETTSDVRLDDEEDGYEATAAWMTTMGAAGHDDAALAAVLRDRG